MPQSSIEALHLQGKNLVVYADAKCHFLQTCACLCKGHHPRFERGMFSPQPRMTTKQCFQRMGRILQRHSTHSLRITLSTQPHPHTESRIAFTQVSASGRPSRLMSSRIARTIMPQALSSPTSNNFSPMSSAIESTRAWFPSNR